MDYFTEVSSYGLYTKKNHSLESMFVKQLGNTKLSSILSIELKTVLFVAQVERDNELLSVVSIQTRNILDHQSLHGDYV